MATDDGAVDHVLPIIGQPKIDQRGEHRVPHTLFGPTPKTDIDLVPLPVAFIHVTPRAADVQHMQHAVQEPSVVVGWTRFATALRRQQHPDDGPFRVRHIPRPNAASKRQS
jgi:hypothetical protein